MELFYVLRFACDGTDGAHYTYNPCKDFTDDDCKDVAVSTFYMHTHTHPSNGHLSGTTRVSRYQKAKPIWILLKQETVSGSGISWAICKFARRSRQITIPVPHQSSFLQAGCPSCRPTNSVKALKAIFL